MNENGRFLWICIHNPISVSMPSSVLCLVQCTFSLIPRLIAALERKHKYSFFDNDPCWIFYWKCRVIFRVARITCMCAVYAFVYITILAFYPIQGKLHTVLFTRPTNIHTHTDAHMETTMTGKRRKNGKNMWIVSLGVLIGSTKTIQIELAEAILWLLGCKSNAIAYGIEDMVQVEKQTCKEKRVTALHHEHELS